MYLISREALIFKTWFRSSIVYHRENLISIVRFFSVLKIPSYCNICIPEMTAACSFCETTEASSSLMSLFESSCTIKNVLVKREYHYSLINWSKRGSLLSFIHAAQWKLFFFLQKFNSLKCLLWHKKKLSLGRNFSFVILNDSSRDILFCTHTYCQQYASWDNRALVKLISNFFRPPSLSYWKTICISIHQLQVFLLCSKSTLRFHPTHVYMSKPLSSDEVSLFLIFRLIYFFYLSFLERFPYRGC